MPTPESLKGSDEGHWVQMYWMRLKVLRSAVGWSWVELDGRRRWVGYPAQVDWELLIWELWRKVGRPPRMIQQSWFWPGMMVQVWVWIVVCKGCQSWKSPLQILVPDGPWNHVAMDLMWPLPERARSNKHVLVVTDPFTKWVVAFPVQNMEAETVAQVMVQEIICRFATPHALHSDQGRTFEGLLMAEVAWVPGLEKTCTTPYHPQADGLVERFNFMFRAMLMAVVT